MYHDTWCDLVVVFNYSVFYKYDFCEPWDLMGREEGGVAVLTRRKVFAQRALL